MFTINDFLNTEGSIIYIINILLESIERQKKNDIDEETFSFNIYSVSINNKLNEVVIYEDIFCDDNESLKIPLNDFYTKLMQIRGEYD